MHVERDAIMREKLSKSNQSVEKALQIIEIMAASDQPMRLQDIAIKAAMPPSTALRIVNTLLTHGYARQDSLSHRYALSMRFARLGDLVLSQASVREMAHPFLVELSKKSLESCCLAEEQDMDVVYTDVVEGPDSMLKIMQRIGKRAPMHCTGVGKLMLTNYSGKALGEFAAAKGLPALTPNTLVTRDALVEELARIRAQGYAMDNEECELGARCVAAPIRNYTGKVVAGISVSGPTSRLSAERLCAITAAVTEAAAKISALLAYVSE
jgi:DNA-binding IclR family transcriptional regulator